jgi:hypothetical protein
VVVQLVSLYLGGEKKTEGVQKKMPPGRCSALMMPLRPSTKLDKLNQSSAKRGRKAKN